jgi:hypothetical protein
MGDLTPNPEEFNIAAAGKDYCVWERRWENDRAKIVSYFWRKWVLSCKGRELAQKRKIFR